MKSPLWFLLATFGCAPLLAQIPAFPGAEGFGGYATGGRGGDVYVVTNLNTSGAGSFADAIATVPTAGRTIVFAVSGHIHVNKTQLAKSKVTIAGQTAPGDGIGFRDGTFIISGDDIVIRHVRFRYGDKAAGGDCVNLDSGTLNAILDQVSIQFSTDENISSFSSPPENVTMQWALNGWGLESHSCGGLWDQNHATCHHSLWAHNHTRNPKARPNGLLEWINNVTYDWDIGFIMGDSQTPANWKANVMNSYFLAPAGNIRTRALEKANLDRNGNPNFSLHLSNCRHDSNGNGVLDGTDKGYSIASGNYITLPTPVANTGAVPVTMDDPTVAFKKIVSKAGALRLDVAYAGAIRDEVDAKMVSNLVTQTRQHISTETALGLSNGGFGTLNSTAAPVDTDKDGMPDFYELALGWNPAVKDHNTVLASSGGVLSGTTFMPPGTVAGYTRLEEYLHFKAIPHGNLPKAVTGSPSSIAVNLAKFTSGFSTAPVFTTSNVVGGTVVVAGNVATFTPTLNFTGRAKFDFTVTDAAGHSWTQTCVLLVTNNALPRDLTWKGGGTAWDTTAVHWLKPSDNTSVAFSGGDRVAFDQTGIAFPTASVTGTISPGSVDVNASGNYTINGSGALGSTGELTKRGTGKLTISNTGPNNFTRVTLAAGELVIGNSTALGTAPIDLEGGILNIGGNAPTDNALTMAGPATITGGSGAGGTGIGVVTGSAPLNIQQSNVFDFRGDMTGYSGEITLLGNSQVRWNGTTGSAAASFDLGAGTANMAKRTTVTTIALGALSGGPGTVLSGATGNTSVTTYEIGARGESTTFQGTISNGGATTSVTKVGAGTLTLTGTNGFTGTTTVSEGSLAVNGSVASPVSVASGAVLRGNGSFNGAVTLLTGAQVSPGAGSGQLGVLTAAGGFTATSSTFSIQLTASPAGVNDKVRVTGGNGQINGTNNFLVIFAEGVLAAGNYKLVECAAGIPLNVGGGMVMNLTTDAPTGTRQTFALNRTASGTTGGYIQLVVTGNAADLVWSGGFNAATWDLNTTGNFLAGGSPDTFYNFDRVLFNDASTNRTIALAGTLEPREVTVDTAAGYTLGGTGSLAGRGALIKNGTGALTISGANSFTGGVILNAGRIQLSNATANASGLGTGLVTMNGGTLRMYSAGDATSAGELPNDLHVVGTATLELAPRGVFSGNVTGNGTLNHYTTYVRADITGNWSGFTGTVNVTSDAGGGDFRVTPNYSWPGLPQATLHLTNNTYFKYDGILNSGAGTTLTIGALSGTDGGRVLGGVTGGRALTYRIGGKNTDAIFSGRIQEQNTGTTTSIVKTGSGVWTLGGASSYLGATTVEAGTLRILSTGSITNNAPFQVKSGATLSLDGGQITADSVAVENGATFTTTGGTLNSELNNAGTLTVTDGTLTVSGDIVNSGTLRVTGLASFVAAGEVVNDGVLDLLTSASSLPANFTNNGVVVENTARRILTATKVGGNFTCTVQGYVGHSYQLQRSTNLSGTWTAVGAAQTGNGTTLTFTDVGGAVGNARFYRVLVVP